jgi:hypothetical protein
LVVVELVVALLALSFGVVWSSTMINGIDAYGGGGGEKGEPTLKRVCHGTGNASIDGRQGLRRLTPGQVDQVIKLRRDVGGSLSYHVNAVGLPKGPSTIAELASWPTGMVHRFFKMLGGGVRRQRVGALLENGFVVHSDCSGKLSPEATLLMLGESLALNGLHLPVGWLVLWRACDSSPYPQEVIKNSVHRPKHLFDGLLGKLPLQHRQALSQLRPPKDASKEIKEAAFKKMNQYMETHARLLYGRHMKGTNCLLHPNSECKLAWEDPVGIPAALRPLTAAIAGTPCRPFCLLGGDPQTLAHPDMEAWYLWINEVKHQDFDFIFLENSEHFMLKLFVDSLPSQYLVKYAIFGSQDQGWPVRRLRTYIVAVNMNTLVWTGAGAAHVVSEFLSYFGASVVVEGDIFGGLDTSSAGQERVRDMARNRGMYPTDEQVKELLWWKLLPPGQSKTYAAALTVHASGSRTGLGGSFNVDLSQSEERIRCGPWIPTLARSTIMCCLNKRHLYTPDEIDFSMGWPSICSDGNKVYSDLLRLDAAYETTSAYARKSLTGNGMQLQQVMGWFLYVAGHTVRKDVLERLRLPLLSAKVLPTVADGDDDDTSSEH